MQRETLVNIGVAAPLPAHIIVGTSRALRDAEFSMPIHTGGFVSELNKAL
jgi:hypothetical protein